jgi:hypothetical protein
MSGKRIVQPHSHGPLPALRSAWRQPHSHRPPFRNNWILHAFPPGFCAQAHIARPFRDLPALSGNAVRWSFPRCKRARADACAPAPRFLLDPRRGDALPFLLAGFLFALQFVAVFFLVFRPARAGYGILRARLSLGRRNGPRWRCLGRGSGRTRLRLPCGRRGLGSRPLRRLLCGRCGRTACGGGTALGSAARCGGAGGGATGRSRCSAGRRCSAVRVVPVAAALVPAGDGAAAGPASRVALGAAACYRSFALFHRSTLFRST